MLIVTDHLAEVAEAGLMNVKGVNKVAPIFFNLWIHQHEVCRPVHSNEGSNFES